MKKWLQDQNCVVPSVHYLFVNSNNKTKITFSTHNPYTKLNVCNSEGLLDKIGEIESHEMEKIIKIANKILKSMNLPYTGKNKGRVYYKPK